MHCQTQIRFLCVVCFTVSAAASEEKMVYERSFNGRSRAHLESLAELDKYQQLDNQIVQKVLKSLSNVYHEMIKPLGEMYKFASLRAYTLSDGVLFSLPQIAFFGSWSAGKSSVINYILGIENNSYSLETGAEPTTTDFTVISHGTEDKTLDGLVLVMDSTYSSLKKYGQAFLERFSGKKLPCNLLKKMTLIDTPGIIENSKQQERGYPFNEVSHWFIDHADMIVVVFDPTKLDVGAELEKLFVLLKGHEAKVRIVLNKADTVSPKELMRVYGTLFWSLSPLIKVTEPPRVYITSLWSKEYHQGVGRNRELLLEEETALLKDIETIIRNGVERKVAMVRQYAVQVRNHALLVAEYYRTLQSTKSMFKNVDDIVSTITGNPGKYKIYERTAANENVSIYDLPPPEFYADFFSMHRMDSFRDVSYHCSFFGECLMDSLNGAINVVLPELIDMLRPTRCLGNHCESDSEKLKTEL